MSEQRFFGGLLPRVRVPKRGTTEAQRRGATSASVPSIPLWFKRPDKNVVLVGVLKSSTRGRNLQIERFAVTQNRNRDGHAG